MHAAQRSQGGILLALSH